MWLGSYWLNYKTWPWSDLNKAIENSQNSGTQNNGTQLDEKEVQEKQNELFRQGTMDDLAGKISEISPAEPVLGGKWYVTRFWFVSDRDIYIEYEDGHIMRRILVKIEGEQERPEYKIIAYFEPGENDWILKSGEDTMFGKPLGLYEFSEEEQEWVKKN